MEISLQGKNLIAGKLKAGGSEKHKAVNPATGTQLEPYFVGATDKEIQEAVEKAWEAQQEYAGFGSAQRADLLQGMAEEIMGLGDQLIERCHQETALPEGRLTGERARTVNQLRMFADLVQEGSWVDARITTTIPDRTPAPRPDLRRMLVPVGPVAVFCASNFPLAFSVAGGDTASALAAGCPVIVKAHSSHPGTAELVATALHRAVVSAGAPAGIFSLVHGPGSRVGIQLVSHPLIRAAGFTGSRRAGRALFDAAVSRPCPIPVYAEMGSINPVFLLPGALARRGGEIAKGLAASTTLGAGQFCTNPGLVIGLESEELAGFIRTTSLEFGRTSVQTMLNSKIYGAYTEGVEKLRGTGGIELIGESAETPDPLRNQGRPTVFSSDGRTFMGNPLLSEEVFGPSTVVIRAADEQQLLQIAAGLDGHLTASIHGTPEELQRYGALVAELQRKVGRLIFNGFPTGVEVCGAMNHGGPYPAATDAHFTSVGTAAVYRFARPICYQDFPQSALPPELQDANPLGILRQVDDAYTRKAL